MVPGPRVVLVLSLVTLSLLTATAGSGAAVMPGESHAVTGESAEQPQTAAGDEATQTLVVDLQRNGDARWTITQTYDLTSANETEAFESLAEDFEAGATSDLGLGSYREASQLAAESTGREMEITDISRTANRTGTATNGTGRLSISFTWTNFGRLDGENFYIDDVFVTDSGTWFDELSADQQLVVRPPEGYRFFDAPVPVTLRNGTIQWDGPQDFSTQPLSATFEQTNNGGSTNTTTAPTNGPSATTGETPGGGALGSLLWAGVVTLGLGLVGYLLVRDRDLLDRPDGDDATASDAETGSAVPSTTGDTTESAEGRDDGDDEDDGIDTALLSDEERVERLLEQNGGRMKQANIVKETNWSNAKVSQLLSAMEDEGRINKLRIGRENLISFPDEDITDFEE